LRWQKQEHAQNLSLSNLHALATATILYAQDWDGRPMPIAMRGANEKWVTWPMTLLHYLASSAKLENPSNPTCDLNVTHPTEAYRIRAGYALNRRFWNTFGRGAFPIDNLDVPAQTALFVEAGRMWKDPLVPPTPQNPAAPFAVLDYGDVGERVRGYCPYPSTHNGRMAVVAADGHAELVKVEHYDPAEKSHDPMYGRIGGGIFNWNGGYPSNELDRPPRE
jgi:prepilin-type processing-associated H-X9-DG protein